MDSSSPGCFVGGILQARTLEWVAIPFSRGVFPGMEPTSPELLVDSLPSEPAYSVRSSHFQKILVVGDYWVLTEVGVLRRGLR